MHLVKLHDPKDLRLVRTLEEAGAWAQATELELYSYRSLADVLASMQRMGWVSDRHDDLRAKARTVLAFHERWMPSADLALPFARIIEDGAAVISELALLLGVPCDQRLVAAVRTELDRLATLPPSLQTPYGHDPVTLMHAAHISSSVDATSIAPSVADVIRELRRLPLSAKAKDLL